MTEQPFTTSVYRELHTLAALQLADQKPGHSLQPTALVHEAYLRIARLKEPGVAGRRQFYALAGKVMRSVLVDHARRRKAQKRQGGQQIRPSPSSNTRPTTHSVPLSISTAAHDTPHLHCARVPQRATLPPNQSPSRDRDTRGLSF